ncbi:MAG TPA: sensor histidine kinase [Negativicutes bacterium]|nr:sensor histidine kinase [Negativicutes bacterium]
MASIQGKHRMPLQYKIMLLAAGLIVLVLILVGSLVVHNVIRQVEDEVGTRAMDIGRLVAQDPVVQAAITAEYPSAVLQPYAERWRQITGAAFIVIANMDQIRLSHTLPEKVGTPMADLYREPVLHGQEYLYVGRGSLEPSLRANVPVWSPSSHVQIGLISVGFYLSEMYQKAFNEVKEFVFVLLAALLCGLLGAVWLARNVKKAIFGLEPYEIARLLQEHVATLEAIKEGVVTVDAGGIVRLMNSEAGVILGIQPEESIGKPIAEMIPFDEEDAPVTVPSALYNREYLVNGITILAHSVPVRLEGEDIGAVITFRDRTEACRLAEELSGVHRFIDGLRAQSHEYKNKLHAIAGLIQLGRNEEAVDFITDSNGLVQEIFDRLQTRIQDPVTFALLVGKSSRARELGIDYQIDPLSALDHAQLPCTGGDMVLILGNLIENAMDAVAPLLDRRISVGVYDTGTEVIIKVFNSGPGISPELGERIYERGVTTKHGARGYGLALVAVKLRDLGGSIHFNNLPQAGVEFIVTIPLSDKQEEPT